MSDRVFDPARRLDTAERQRDEAIGFLAHDARAPAAAILGLVELARTRQSTGASDELLRAIEDEARNSLELMGGFVVLAHAETRVLKLEALDLRALLQQAVDQAWIAGAPRRIALQLAGHAGEAPVLGDRGLLPEALARAFGELVAGSPPQSKLECRLERDGEQGQWQVRLALPAREAGAARRSQPLRLLRLAVQRHGGQLDLDLDADGQAVALTMGLPQLE